MYMKNKVTTKYKHKHMKNKTLRKKGGGYSFDNANNDQQPIVKIRNNEKYETEIFSTEIEKLSSQLLDKKEHLFIEKVSMDSIVKTIDKPFVTSTSVNSNIPVQQSQPQQQENLLLSYLGEGKHLQKGRIARSQLKIQPQTSYSQNPPTKPPLLNEFDYHSPQTQGGGVAGYNNKITNIMYSLYPNIFKGVKMNNADIDYKNLPSICNFINYININYKSPEIIINMCLKIFLLNDYLYNICQFQPCNINLNNITILPVTIDGENIDIPIYLFNTGNNITPTLSYIDESGSKYIRIIYDKHDKGDPENKDKDYEINNYGILMRHYYDLNSKIKITANNDILVDDNIFNNELITYIMNPILGKSSKCDTIYSLPSSIIDTNYEAYNEYPLNSNDYYNIVVLRIITDTLSKSNNPEVPSNFDRNKFYNLYFEIINKNIENFTGGDEIIRNLNKYIQYIMTPLILSNNTNDTKKSENQISILPSIVN